MSETIIKPFILIVDDIPENLDVLYATLRATYTVRTALNGPLALKRANMDPQPDLILLDVIMPVMDGYEVCQQLKSTPRTKEIPVIFITGKTQTEDELKGLKMGAVDYIHKPISPPIVQARVAFHLALKKAHLELQEKNKSLNEFNRLLSTSLKELSIAKTEAEEATRLKDKFVSLVAHDLRSPLSSILGFIQYIIEDNENQIVPEHLTMLQRAFCSGQNLIKMVEEILDIARLKSGKIILKKTFFDVHSFIQTILKRVEYEKTNKGVHILATIPEGMRLYGDIDLIGEVLQNLLTNAIKFSTFGDTIHIGTPKEELSSIVIQDQGVGIPDHIIPKLFNMAEKVSTPGTSGEKGTGFGLPFSFDIMKAHGGQLEVDSTFGKGSSFKMVFPLVQPKILVVDDEEIYRDILVQTLNVLNIDILEADHGAEAWEKIIQHEPHLILADVFMPVMDGFQLLEKLKQSDKYKHIPIILITGHQNTDIKLRALRMGATDFTNKPINLDDFFPRIRYLMGI
ncbi:MAG: response regulator [Magnetococcus sp. DMHC-6]